VESPLEYQWNTAVAAHPWIPGFLDPQCRYHTTTTVRRRMFENEIVDGLSCSICFNDYDEMRHIPVVTTCGHTFCKFCSNSLPMKNGRQAIDCPVCRIEVKIPLANNYSLISLLKCWHANIVGSDFIVPHDRKHQVAASLHQNFEMKIQKVSAAAAPPLPPAPPRAPTASQSTRPPRVSKSQLNTDLAVAFAGHLAPEVDDELLKILIRQNFFKEDGVYAYMLPDTESDSEEDEDENDDEDEDIQPRHFFSGFAMMGPGPETHSDRGNGLHGRGHHDQTGGQGHHGGRNHAGRGHRGGRHHGGHGGHQRGRGRGGRRGGHGRGSSRGRGRGGGWEPVF
jgi:hypothetical protein